MIAIFLFYLFSYLHNSFPHLSSLFPLLFCLSSMLHKFHNVEIMEGEKCFCLTKQLRFSISKLISSPPFSDFVLDENLPHLGPLGGAGREGF